MRWAGLVGRDEYQPGITRGKLNQPGKWLNLDFSVKIAPKTRMGRHFFKLIFTFLSPILSKISINFFSHFLFFCSEEC